MHNIGIILGMDLANERRRKYVTPLLIGQAGQFISGFTKQNKQTNMVVVNVGFVCVFTMKLDVIKD